MDLFKGKPKFTIFPVLFLSLIFLAGCGNDNKSTYSSNNPPPENQGNTINISNFSFSPSSITVAAGDTVSWRNDDNAGHTVTSDTGNELNSPLLSQRQTYTHVFRNAGTYPYHCTVHPAMRASVAVQ